MTLQTEEDPCPNIFYSSKGTLLYNSPEKKFNPSRRIFDNSRVYFRGRNSKILSTNQLLASSVI